MMPPAKTILPQDDQAAAIDGDADMTPKQAAILRSLCEELGEEFDGNLTEAQAAERIEALEARRDG